MLALAKFWLPFQKWRIIGKKRRQNGYMLKNLCVFCLFFASFTFFFLGWRRRYAILISPHVVFTISCQATFSMVSTPGQNVHLVASHNHVVVSSSHLANSSSQLVVSSSLSQSVVELSRRVVESSRRVVKSSCRVPLQLVDSSCHLSTRHVAFQLFVERSATQRVDG